MDSVSFIADQNVGKLARFLRMLGFNTLFFTGQDDGELVRLALAEGRIILTRDTHIMERKLVTGGRLKAVLIKSDIAEEQVCQVINSLDLRADLRPFTLCLEDNHPLETRGPEEVKTRVPPYVFKTQTQYVECPFCRRIYWRGTHWQAMKKRLEKLAEC